MHVSSMGGQGMAWHSRWESREFAHWMATCTQKGRHGATRITPFDEQWFSLDWSTPSEPHQRHMYSFTNLLHKSLSRKVFEGPKTSKLATRRSISSQEPVTDCSDG